jgi:hypothetical protein
MTKLKVVSHACEGNTYSGFEAASKAKGYEWIWWDENIVPLHDVLHEVQPDVVFTMQKDVMDGVARAFAKHSVKNIVGDVSTPFSFTVRNFSTNNGAIVVKSDEYEFALLVDVSVFNPQQPPVNPLLQCDIGITAKPCKVGLDVCTEVGKYNVKVLSDKEWSVPQYLGIGSLENKRDLYHQAKVVIVDQGIEEARAKLCRMNNVVLSCETDVDFDKLVSGEVRRHYSDIIQSYEYALEVLLDV